MSNTQFTALCAIFAVQFGVAGGALAQPAKEKPAPAAVNVSMCTGCHGIAGYRTAYPDVYHVPKIAGQQAAYIVKALQAYKSGERRHPSMRGIAATLSDKEMNAFAAYYAGGGK